MDRNTVSASVYIVLVIVSIVSRLWSVPFGREAGVVLTILFLAIEAGRAPPLQRNVGAVLAVLGVIAAWAGGGFPEAVIEGLVRSQIFVVMFFAVMWLREPAVTSPSLRDLRDAVVRQPAGRRYPILWLSAHFLGSVLNLAAMSLLSTMVSEQSDKRLRKRLSIALMYGFTTASAWGPFYVSIAVVLSAIPGVRWIEIAPLGFGMSMGLLFLGWGYDRLFLRQRPSQNEGRDSHPPSARTIGRTALVLVQLIFLVMGTHEIVGLSIPITLGIIGPPFAIAWAMVQAKEARAWGDGAAPLIKRIFVNTPELRNETVAFVAASVFGLGVSKILPPDVIGAELQALGIGADLLIFGLVTGMTLAGVMGLHPVILAILVGEVLPPEVIGLPPAVLAIAILGVWGTSTMVSPFSATTLFMSRVVSVPSHVIAWRWSTPLIALSALTVAGFVVIVKHVLYS